MRPFAFFIPFALAASLAVAQQQAPTETLPHADDNTAAVTPEQLRHVEPPSPHLSAERLEEIGDLLREHKSYADALDYYRAAMEKEPRRAALYNKAGITQLKLLRHRDARKDFRRAVRLKPDYAEAHNNLGVIDYIERKYRRAIRHYRKAVELRPHSASFHSNLGTAHFARRQYDQAGHAYLRALELDPEIFERRSGGGVSAHLASPEDRAKYAYTIAKMHARLGDTERCLLYLRRAMEDGYRQIDSVYRDEEFALVRQDPRFEELMTERPVPVP